MLFQWKFILVLTLFRITGPKNPKQPRDAPEVLRKWFRLLCVSASEHKKSRHAHVGQEHGLRERERTTPLTLGIILHNFTQPPQNPVLI